MHGRSITGSFLIVDEAQNASRSQMRNIITRVTMLLAFDKIYVSTKNLWKNGIISENDFWILKDELQDVDRK